MKKSMSTACSTATVDLKSVLAQEIPKRQDIVKKLKTHFGDNKLGEIKISHVYGGMRGMKSLLCETSQLDPENGIRFRGLSIPECQLRLPKIKEQPLPEGIFWLLLTGKVPTKEEVDWVSKEWADRASLPGYVVTQIHNFPSTMHPMSQLSSVVTTLNCESKFAKAYSDGVKKTCYWEFVYEDVMDLIAKLPVIAAKIYLHSYREGKGPDAIDPKCDWSGNFTKMMGFDCADFTELMRLYLTIHW